MAWKLGQLESAFMAYTQMRNLRTVRSGDLIAPLKLSVRQEQNLLSRMNRRGIIAQVRRGLYLVPARLPLGGVWTPDEAAALGAIMTDKQSRYQVTGPNAFNRYGFDEQIPSRIYVYNDAISGDRTIGKIELTLIKVNPERLGDTEQIETPSGDTMVYSSRVRTLVDAVYDWSRFDSLPRGYDWIRSDIEANRIDPSDLAKSTVRYGNRGSVRRIGALLDEFGASEKILKRLERALSLSGAKIPLVPARPTRGALMKRWGVVNNA
jgi:predicted transcriptional regulator of viral defense system